MPRAVNEVFQATRSSDCGAIVHTAAQPSHDWAARDPQMDFTVNANGTLNLLEAARNFCPEAPFVFTSTNKVYGDTPNRLPLARIAAALGNRARSRIRARHFRDDEHRPDEALALWRVEGRGRRARAGIRPLLWNADRLLSRRLPDGSGACRHGAARVSLLSHEVRGERPALSRLSATRANRCATTFTASTWSRLSPRSLAAPRVGRGLQHRRQSPLQLLDARSDRALRRNQRPKIILGIRRGQPHRRPHLVDQ